MLYFKCPSCHTKLADKQIPLEEGYESICNDTKLTDSQKEKAKRDLIDKLQFVRYCCRSRALTYLDLIKIIK